MHPTYFTADTATRYQCRHIFPDGHRCGSPSLRHEPLCYHHHTTRRPIEGPAARKARLGTFHFPANDIDHRSGIQLALGQVLERIASNDLDPRRAGLLLYGLQVASLTLPRNAPLDQPTTLVEDLTTDPELGTLALPTELQNPEEDTTLTRLLETLRQATDEPQQPEPAEEETTEAPEELLPTLQAVADPPSLLPTPDSLLPALSTLRLTKSPSASPCSSTPQALYQSAPAYVRSS